MEIIAVFYSKAFRGWKCHNRLVVSWLFQSYSTFPSDQFENIINYSEIVKIQSVLACPKYISFEARSYSLKLILIYLV